jgi:hypothetical protein
MTVTTTTNAAKLPPVGRDIQQLGDSRPDGCCADQTRSTRAHRANLRWRWRVAAERRWGETPLLRLANFSGPWIQQGMDDELWQAVADLHREEVKLDEASIA